MDNLSGVLPLTGSDNSAAEQRLPRLLITAGPTHEAIDSVRYLANRSSGRLGIAIAEEAASRGWPTTLLLGPTALGCSDTHVRTIRFVSTADLGDLLAEHAPSCDSLIMAAAVADFRPAPGTEAGAAKVRRNEDGFTLHLEPTPDLLAAAAENRSPGQCFVGFALEPRESLLASARAKLLRKGVDLIVANPLETMDSEAIEATLLESDPVHPDAPRIVDSTPGPIAKSAFARWLLDRLCGRLIGDPEHGSRTV